MYSTEYLRSMLPILENALFFAVVFVLARRYLQIQWIEYLILVTFVLAVIPFAVLPVGKEETVRIERTAS